MDIKGYTDNIKTAINVLGKKNLSLIVHDLSFPSSVGADIGAGSPYSQEAKDFISFLYLHGFNSIQLGPSGKTKSIDPSPYIGTLFSSNPLFIDLKQLSQEGYGCILDQALIDDLVRASVVQDNRIDHDYLFDRYYSLLSEAYNGFKDKFNGIAGLSGDEARVIRQLDKEFRIFQEDNSWWLHKDSLYEALSIENGNDYWPLWGSDTDRNIFTYIEGEDISLVEQANIRVSEVRVKYKNVIELYEFTQFIGYKQKFSTKVFAEGFNFKLIADSQVAFSDRDIWANQAIFLDGYFMGAPPDYFSDSGQAWGFPVLDPDKIFNSRGLGKAGVFLKNKFLKIFRENDGVRIDHIIGLIDPWVYKANDNNDARVGGGRLYSSPDIEGLGGYSYIGMDNLDPEYIDDYGNERRVKGLTDAQVNKYSQVIERVVIESAKEAGKGDDFILICEDLGSLTNPVVAVLNKLKLSGIRVTHFVEPDNKDHIYRGVNVGSMHWIVMGTHDNDSTLNWVNTLNDDERYSHIRYLVKDIYPYLRGDDFDNVIRRVMSDRLEFFRLKVAELFISPAENIQIFFTDFFGMSERYNVPATAGKENWSLRLPSFYESMYYGTQLPMGYGINLPEILVMVFEAKGIVNKHKELVLRLRGYANSLKGGI